MEGQRGSVTFQFILCLGAEFHFFSSKNGLYKYCRNGQCLQKFSLGNIVARSNLQKFAEAWLVRITVPVSLFVIYIITDYYNNRP
jgi:hypothetical protein